MSIAKALNTLDLIVPDPKLGLPDEMFHFISRTTPLVNVDLLIKDERNRTLLAWRNDAYCERGWHIPGGIIRFKETFEERLKKVVELKIGTSVDVNPSPIAINELISQLTDVRGSLSEILCVRHNMSKERNMYATQGEGGRYGDRGGAVFTNDDALNDIAQSFRDWRRDCYAFRERTTPAGSASAGSWAACQKAMTTNTHTATLATI